MALKYEKNFESNNSIRNTSVGKFMIWLDINRLLYPTINFIILLVLIGFNSVIRNEYSNGVLFLILVFLILISGNEPTENFFGASAIPLFIILHLSMFSFNSLSLIVTFIVFIILKKYLGKNLLGPISIYLTFDTFFYYIDIGQKLKEISSSVAKTIFTFEVFLIITIFPIFMIYLTYEHTLKRRFKALYKYGYFLVIEIFILILYFTGFLLNNSILLISGMVITLLYIAEALKQKRSLLTLLIFLVLIFLFYSIK